MFGLWKLVWDINTKFLPVEDHNRRQLLTKFEGSWCAQIWISCQNILKLKWAWRAQFLSYAFQILQKCITFEDAQMILLALLKILSLNRIFKKSIQLLVHPFMKSTYNTIQNKYLTSLTRSLQVCPFLFILMKGFFNIFKKSFFLHEQLWGVFLT